MAKHSKRTKNSRSPRHLVPMATDRTSFAVAFEDAIDPLVMALDVGSTATRGSLHDARGVPVRGFRQTSRGGEGPRPDEGVPA